MEVSALVDSPAGTPQTPGLTAEILTLSRPIRWSGEALVELSSTQRNLNSAPLATAADKVICCEKLLVPLVLGTVVAFGLSAVSAVQVLPLFTLANKK